MQEKETQITLLNLFQLLLHLIIPIEQLKVNYQATG